MRNNQYRSKPRDRKDRRGAALIFAMMVLMVMSISGLALAASSLNALRSTKAQEDSALAFNLAEAGIARATLWLRQQPSVPTQTTAFNPFTSAQSLGTGTYTVTIDGDDT